MKVAIDARELCGRPTGVGRYLWHLLQAWNELPEASAHRFVLYLPTSPELAGAGFPHPPQHDRPASAPPSRVAPGVQPSLSFSALALDVRTVAGGSGTMWEQVRLPAALRHDRPDVLLAPAYTAPIATTVPTVLTVHDLSFVAHPEWFPVVTRVRRRVLVQLAARRARRVLTDAEFSRRELVERLGISAEKVQVIPLGVARPTVPGTADSREHGPMVLFVGSIFNRRHLPELIRAVAAVACRHPGVRLEIVGDNRTYPVEDLGMVVAEANLTGRVSIRSYVGDATLADLYASASVFAFLSEYEGFGLTPLEALDARIPILVGDTPIAHEVYGEAARFVPTTDVPAIAEALEQLLFDPAARAAVLDHAPAVIGRYSWERAGRDTLAALAEAARG